MPYLVLPSRKLCVSNASLSQELILICRKVWYTINAEGLPPGPTPPSSNPMVSGLPILLLIHSQFCSGDLWLGQARMVLAVES